MPEETTIFRCRSAIFINSFSASTKEAQITPCAIFVTLQRATEIVLSGVVANARLFIL